jgi:hypothetical protein
VGVKFSFILSIILGFDLFAIDNKPLNYSLRGSNHSVTNVPFNRLGYPIFESKFNCHLPFHLINVSDNKQFTYCTNKLREAIKRNPNLKKGFTKEQLKEINKKSPNIKKFTWHHHQSKSKRLLQLVDRKIHDKTAHSGGRANYGGGKLGRLGKVEAMLESSTTYKSNVISKNDYNKIAKSLNKKAIAVPAVITYDNKLFMSIKSGTFTGIATIAIDGGSASYDYLKGNIYKSEFEEKVLNATIKGLAVGGMESLVVFLVPSPHGLLLLGVGVGTYIIVDNTLGEYKRYKERHFLNRDDLKVYGIEMDSVLDINDNNVPLNIDKW